MLRVNSLHNLSTFMFAQRLCVALLARLSTVQKIAPGSFENVVDCKDCACWAAPTQTCKVARRFQHTLPSRNVLISPTNSSLRCTVARAVPARTTNA